MTMYTLSTKKLSNNKEWVLIHNCSTDKDEPLHLSVSAFDNSSTFPGW